MCLDHPVFGHLPRVLTAFEHSVPLFDAPATKSVEKGPSVGSNLPKSFGTAHITMHHAPRPSAIAPDPRG
jgi:hypothetical protein